jgi:hypothetical protein
MKDNTHRKKILILSFSSLLLSSKFIIKCVYVYLDIFLYEQIVLPIENRSLNVSKIKIKQRKNNNHCVIREEEKTITTLKFAQ